MCWFFLKTRQKILNTYQALEDFINDTMYLQANDVTNIVNSTSLKNLCNSHKLLAETCVTPFFFNYPCTHGYAIRVLGISIEIFINMLLNYTNEH